ncbi:hypothetical protein WG66_010711 [Moniliophthora roreri]|nr:hypothetical protein WG66_010711 [Moniliophthora roreri]
MECRASNRKFRDSDFDLEKDRNICLHGIYDEKPYDPSDVQRVSEIFKDPQFFVDGADSNDIVQGAIGDCWFVSALATLSTAEALLEQCCPARDEEVGVYGFIFFRDKAWETVIIDDYLYTSIPKFEELKASERELYHNDKQLYNNSARKNGKGLYFGKSATDEETWVPLIEKAYAKLHGCYYALSGGYSNEGVEDLTGGISTYVAVRDIFDTDRFWSEELLKANIDRLFGCSYKSLDGTRSGDDDIKINGLIGGHAYSVLRAVEHKGKRFVVIRNPWGEGEWTGPWADGSKEWTPEWLEAIPVLGHMFGDDGQFVMEYKDFLECWDHISRNLLLDSSWVMSCQWLHVRTKVPFRPGSYGDVSFTFSLPESTPAIIVLSQIDKRYFEPIPGRCAWRFEFVLFKEGQKEPIGKSSHTRVEPRSVNLEIELEAGDYVVHVRLDRREVREQGYLKEIEEEKPQRAMIRVFKERAKGRSLAANYNAKPEVKRLPQPLSNFAGRSLATAESEEESTDDEESSSEEEEEEKEDKEEVELKVSDLNSIFLGLKVYTHEDAPASNRHHCLSRHSQLPSSLQMGLSRATRIKLLLAIDIIFFFVELGVGCAVRSLALIADSFHMLNDVVSLIVALYAIKLTAKNATDSRYSYGWHRAEILAALTNGVFLLAICVSIFLEAIQRFATKPEVGNPRLIVIVGAWGLLSNMVGLFLFHEHGHSHSHSTPPNAALTELRDKHEDTVMSRTPIRTSDELQRSRSRTSSSLYGHPAATRAALVQTAEEIAAGPSSEPPIEMRSQVRMPSSPTHRGDHSHSHGHSHGSMNMRGILLHVAGDALTNIGVIATGLIIWLTNWSFKIYFDPMISLVIAIIICASAVPLVRSTSLILLQGVPRHVSLDDVRSAILAVDGVLSVHELHVWQLSESKTVASVHVLASPSHDFMPVAAQIRNALHHHGIHSSTIQPEYNGNGTSSEEGSCLIVCPKDENCNPQENACCRDDWSPQLNMGEKDKISRTPKRGKSSKKKSKPYKEYTQRKQDFAIVITDELDAAAAACKLEVERISRECRASNQKFRDLDFDLEKYKEACLYGIYPEDDHDEEYDPSDVQRVTEIFKEPQFFVDGRDEEVGVYGFVFFRDKGWVHVIIDDYLYTSIPKFEELKASEKELYHNDKQLYNNSARKNGKGLYFAKSAVDGETWAPLIEKAYAKLHGCYSALSGGYSNEAVEDMTGGFSTVIYAKDIFDTDRFWTEELLQANIDRVFGCVFMGLSSRRNSDRDIRVHGLIGGHAYSVLRAVEYKGKRFVVVRNPWGESEWTGPWSDGSKEWTPEWLEALPVLGHIFGDDGQFVMEYKDFLECWQQIDRTLILDPSWVMSTQWLHVRVKSPFRIGSYGDVSFTFSLPEQSRTLIVLSLLDERYYQPISGRCAWKLGFVLYKEGKKEPIGKSYYSPWESRSVNLEIDKLEGGDYVVHVQLDRREYRTEGYMKAIREDNPTRALVRAISDRAKARSLAANFNNTHESKLLPVPISSIAGRSLAAEVEEEEKQQDDDDEHTTSDEDSDEEEEGPKVSEMLSVFLGLKVYIHEDAPASVSGQLCTRKK